MCKHVVYSLCMRIIHMARFVKRLNSAPPAISGVENHLKPTRTISTSFLSFLLFILEGYFAVT